MTVLEVDITKRLGSFSLDVSFSIERPDEIMALLGPSGCGKSMTLKCIAGIERPDAGRIVLGDKAAFLSPIGQIWLNMLFVLLVPLIFFSISSSIAAIGDTRRVFRAGRWCRHGNHADLELRLPECGPADPHHDDPALRPGLHPRQLLR